MVKFFRVVLLQIYLGSGAAQILNDFFRIRILLKVSDPSVSGSTILLTAMPPISPPPKKKISVVAAVSQ
jgi:hypothetical protein